MNISHINKQHVSDMLRARVRGNETISVWMGVPLESFDKDELILIINEIGRDLTATRRQHIRDMEMLR